MTITVYRIDEIPQGWSVTAPGLPTFIAPTAIDALSIVTTAEQVAVDRGDDVRVAQVEWNPTTSIGRSVVSVVAS